MGKKQNKDIIIIDKKKLESVIVLIVLLILTVVLGVMLTKSILETRGIEQKRELDAIIERSSFVDEELNIMYLYPQGWFFSEVGQDLLDYKKEVIYNTTNGEVFSILEHSLEEELVSALILNTPIEKEDGTQSHSQFVSVSLMGDDTTMSNKERLEFLKERFVESIEQANGLDYDSLEIVRYGVTPEGGYYIELEVVMGDVNVYYAQYSEISGKNIATALMGSRIEEDYYSVIQPIVSSIKTRW